MSHESLFAPEHIIDAELTTLPLFPGAIEYGSPALLKVLREWFLNHPRDAKVAGLIVNLIDSYPPLFLLRGRFSYAKPTTLNARSSETPHIGTLGVKFPNIPF